MDLKPSTITSSLEKLSTGVSLSHRFQKINETSTSERETSTLSHRFQKINETSTSDIKFGTLYDFRHEAWAATKIKENLDRSRPYDYYPAGSSDPRFNQLYNRRRHTQAPDEEFRFRSRETAMITEQNQWELSFNQSFTRPSRGPVPVSNSTPRFRDREDVQEQPQSYTRPTRESMPITKNGPRFHDREQVQKGPQSYTSRGPVPVTNSRSRFYSHEEVQEELRSDTRSSRDPMPVTKSGQRFNERTEVYGEHPRTRKNEEGHSDNPVCVRIARDRPPAEVEHRLRYGRFGSEEKEENIRGGRFGSEEKITKSHQIFRDGCLGNTGSNMKQRNAQRINAMETDSYRAQRSVYQSTSQGVTRRSNKFKEYWSSFHLGHPDGHPRFKNKQWSRGDIDWFSSTSKSPHTSNAPGDTEGFLSVSAGRIKSESGINSSGGIKSESGINSDGGINSRGGRKFNGGINSRGGRKFNGSMNFGGGRKFGNGMKSGGGMKVGNGMKAGGGMKVGNGMKAGGGMKVGNGMKAGDGIKARGGMKSRGGINTRGGRKFGGGMKSGGGKMSGGGRKSGGSKKPNGFRGAAEFVGLAGTGVSSGSDYCPINKHPTYPECDVKPRNLDVQLDVNSFLKFFK